MTWADSFLRTLKANDVRLVSYVPDNVLTPLIAGAAADNYFISVGATREDEAVGTVAGAYMRDPPLIRHRFMRGLGTGRTSALDD
jgi:sulfopyruvate decarboxylase TPP-binding subunit